MSEDDLDDICRICGGSLDVLRESIQYHEEYISKYLPVEIDDSKLPRYICGQCLSLLFSWNDLYERCAKVQTKLTRRLSRKKVLKENEDFMESVDCVKKPKLEPAENLRPPPTNRTYKCHFCPHTAESQELHNDHVVSAHCDLVFCCDICKGYLPRTSLITHMTDHALDTENTQPESPKDSEWNCPECSRQFTSKSGLNYHITSTHGKPKQFQCADCQNVFPCKRVLLNHCRSVHSDSKQFDCDVCGKKFKTDSTLYAHRKIHSEAAPYKCDVCGKAFKFRHHLSVHAVRHKPIVKPFECGYCKKKFTAQNNLTKHKKIHDKTMEFECHICGVKVMQRRYLKDHMKRVHQVMLECLGTSFEAGC